MSEMVQRVGRLIAAQTEGCEGCGSGAPLPCVQDPEILCECLQTARAVIETMREPTAAMIDAGRREISDQHVDLTWPAMVDAALKESE